MITLRKKGHYRLVATRRHTKILYVDKRAFAWVELGNQAEILVVSRKHHKTDYVLARGRYRLYEVADERHLSDQVHLELEIGEGQWQGYLLLSGLPGADRPRGRIIPTIETITPQPNFVLQ